MLLCGFATKSLAQVANWNGVGGAFYNPALAAPAFAATTPAANARGAAAASRGPLARLVSNPDHSNGLPPFALTDQSGAIQRYVEPVPGIDLAPYLGEVVVVRHDTGRTLLASQLELPMQPLRPMVEISNVSRPGIRQPSSPLVQQTNFAEAPDSDDSTVELLDEGEELPNGTSTDTTVQPMPMEQGMIYHDEGYSEFPGQPMMPSGPMFGVSDGEPMMCDPSAGPWMPGEATGGPCPKCGRFHAAQGFPPGTRLVSAFGHNINAPSHVYADVELNFLRLHLAETAVGKLSEKYDFSPRFILGFTGLGPLDARVRYWTYGRTTRTLDDDENDIRFEFDVLDLEATHAFCGKRSEVVLGAGIRLAKIDLIDDYNGQAWTDLVGLTMAADGRTRLASLEVGRLSWVYGGRLSILGGDWGADRSTFLNGRERDDNVVVHELYVGLEAARCYRNLELHARLAFEMQNWHSDVLAQSVLDTDSIGILGPGIRVGAEF